MKKILPLIMIALVMTAVVSCNKKHGGNTKIDKMNDSVSMQAGEFMGSQLVSSILSDSINGPKVDRDAFYEGFASIFGRDTTDADNSYLGGVQVAFRAFQMLQQMGVDPEALDRETFLREFKRALASDKALTTEDLQKKETALNNLIMRVATEKGKGNAKAGAEYMKKRSAEKGFKKTPSGIMYRVIKEGKGDNFTDDDQINVIYTGKKIDGTTFDDSQGQPRPMSPKQVVPGFAEMLKLMKPGMKVEVIIPGEMAYGVQGGGPIGPNETLVFEMETVGKAEKPQMPQGQPQIVPVQ